ncbi:Gfo/Idh/MocA family oxidoreductase [Streptomyces sp. KL116D]|uniref:Gfo/Idh/MocA family oxidoreductase n=1 Tax=Streptomyces sp. KL116D TaxID=3045152 RepID=UPI0035591E5A
MPPSALRIGLIGAGRMGTAHAGFIAREEETVLVGVADPSSSALAEAEGVPHFADHHALLDPNGGAGLDAVIVAPIRTGRMSPQPWTASRLACPRSWRSRWPWSTPRQRD